MFTYLEIGGERKLTAYTGEVPKELDGKAKKTQQTISAKKPPFQREPVEQMLNMACSAIPFSKTGFRRR